MNKKLLLFAVAMVIGLASFAQDFAKPVPTDYQFATEFEDSTVYYLYNVDAPGFINITSASTHSQWTTNTAVNPTSGFKTRIIKYVPEATDDDPEPQWDLKTYIIENYYNNSYWNPITLTSAFSTFPDSKQPNYFWYIKSMGNGVFHISVADANPTFNPTYAEEIFGNSETYFGFNALDPDYDTSLDNPAMPLTPMISADNMVYIPADEALEEADPKIDWKLMLESEYVKYQSHLQAWNYMADGTLMNYIEEVSNSYPSISTDALVAFLDSTDPVLYEDIQAEIAKVDAQIREIQIAELIDGASEDNPKELTSLLNNPDIEISESSNTGSVTGWICNYTKGTNVTNLGRQTNATYTNGDVTLSNFIEGWSNSAFNTNYTWKALGDGSIYQTVEGLPAGKYQFECDAIAVRQSDASDPATGVYLYAKSGELLFRQAIATGNGAPEHFVVSFVAEEGTMEFGFMTENANANWVALDNFQIFYYGEVEGDPYKIALDDYIAQVESQYPDLSDVIANDTIKTALVDAIDAGKSATSDYESYQTAIATAVKNLQTSVSEYNTLATLISTTGPEKQEQYSEGPFAGLGDLIGDLLMEWEEEYNNETAYSAYISAQSQRLEDLIVDYITENLQAGDEITDLIKNPDFKSNFSEWTSTGSTPVFGGANGANIIGDVAGYKDNGCAEVYHANFDMYQVIKNMPKGSFTLTCQAFERPDYSGTEGVNAFESLAQGPEANIFAVLYAGNTQKKVNNIAAYAQPSLVYALDEALSTWGHDLQPSTEYNADGLYIPNCMNGANAYFHLDEDRQTYVVKLNFTLEESGDLRIGLKKESGTSGWVIFDNFRLYYNGDGIDAYAEEISELEEKIAELQDEEAKGTDSDSKLAEALAALKSVSTGDDCIAAISQAQEAIAYAEESIELYSELSSTEAEGIYMTLSDAIETYQEIASEETLAEAADVLDQISDAASKKNLTNEEAQALIEKAEYLASSLQYPSVDGASFENPIDLTDYAIKNPSFTGHDYSYWEGSGFGSGGTLASDDLANAERYNMAFDTYQDIYGLPAGNYVVRVQGFFRRGGSSNDYTLETSEDPNTGRDALLYAVGTEEVSTPIASPSSAAKATGSTVEVAGEEISYAGSSVGTSLVIPNTMQQASWWYEGGDYWNEVPVTVGEDGKLRIGAKLASVTYDTSWFNCDNWQLIYIGSDEATAIKTVTPATTAAAGIYNIQGQKLSAPQKGINIINGKKVYIK